MDGPQSRTKLFNKACRAGEGTADNESYVALGMERPALEFCQQRGPIDVGAGGLVHTVITHITYNADDLTPIVDGGDSNALAKRFAGRAPIFAREILGDKRNGNSVIRIRPSEITTSDERYAQSMEISGRDEQEMPKRRRRSLRVSAVCCEDIVEPTVSIHRDST